MTSILRCITARFDLRGQADSRFNNGVGLTFPTGLGELKGLGLGQSPNHIFIAGMQIEVNWPYKSNLFALKLDQTNGNFSLPYGNAGIAVRPLPNSKLGIIDFLGATLDADGKLTLAGRARETPDSGIPFQVVFARLTDRGAFDHTFGNEGVIQESEERCSGYTRLQDGRLVTAFADTSQPALLHFLFCDPADDSIKRTAIDCGLDGMLLPTLLTVHQGYVYVCGIANVGINSERGYFLARLDGHGALDRSFGSGGVVISRFNSQPIQIRAMCVSDLGIHLAGYGPTPVNYFGVARHTLSGAPDKAFSGDGKRLVTCAYLTNIQVNAITVTAAGQVVIAGSANSKVFLASFTPQGDTDGRFGENSDPLQVGTLLYNQFSHPDNANPDTFVATALALSPDGSKLLIAGYSSETS